MFNTLLTERLFSVNHDSSVNDDRGQEWPEGVARDLGPTDVDLLRKFGRLLFYRRPIPGTDYQT